jgi:hypothetical protein
LDRTIEDGPAKTETKVNKPAKKQVESVRDTAEAIEYFASIGKTVRTKKQVQALSDELGIEFPNLKE